MGSARPSEATIAGIIAITVPAFAMPPVMMFIPPAAAWIPGTDHDPVGRNHVREQSASDAILQLVAFGTLLAPFLRRRVRGSCGRPVHGADQHAAYRTQAALPDVDRTRNSGLCFDHDGQDLGRNRD